MWFEEMKNFFKGRNVHGRNLGKEEIKFGSMADVLPEKVESGKEALKRFETAVINLFESSDDIEASPMVIKNDQVVIKEGTYFHRFPSELEALEGVSVAGILCSEMLGYLESSNEGCFCAFLNTTTEKLCPKQLGNEFVLYFDSDHPVMNMLVENDYFEYINRKKQIRRKLFDSLSDSEKEKFYEEAEKRFVKEQENRSSWQKLDEQGKREKIEQKKQKFIDDYSSLLPQSLKDRLREILKIEYGYSNIILDLFDQVVEPLSKQGITTHDNENSEKYYWKAIPGGIPPSLVNGIQINTHDKNPVSKKDIERMQEMFPKAVIFDENKRVIARPLKVVR